MNWGGPSLVQAFSVLNRTANNTLPSNSILRRLSLDLDQADARILRPPIMLPIAQIANPRLQRRRVVLAHLLPIQHNLRLARDARPLAHAVEEAEVDVRVAAQVVRLAGLDVCVEDQVDAGGLFAGERHAAGDELAAGGDAGGHHAELALLHKGH